MKNIDIEGIRYELVRSEPFTFRGKERLALYLKRPRGKRIYHAVKYENGAISQAHPVPGQR